VLSDRRLESIAAWQHAISAEGLGLVLSTQTPFDALDGFLPAELCERRTGFECAHRDPETLIGEHPNSNFAARPSYTLAFRYDGRDIFQAAAAWMAGAAYAKAADGMLFDDGVGRRPITPESAVQHARNLEQNVQVIRSIPGMEADLQLVLNEINTDRPSTPQNKSETLPPADRDYKITVRRIN
jgi:hypothetical protein